MFDRPLTSVPVAPERLTRRLWHELGLRETSVDSRPLAIILAGVAALLIAQSLVSALLTGYPAFVLGPISPIGGGMFIVALPLLLLAGAFGALRLPQRLIWLTGFPMLLVGIALQLLATLGTSDHTSGGLFILLLIQFFAGYQLRPVGAWVGCALVTIALSVNAAVLLAPSEAARNLLVGGIVTGTATWMLIHARDSQESLARQYRAEARHDALTGVRSRLALTEWAEVMLPLAGPGTGLVLVDVDHFKRLNDRHGHPIGDAMLRHVARLATEAVPHDMVTRLGGDEFGVLMPKTSADQVARRAALLSAHLAEHPLQLPDGTTLPVQVSMGTAHLPPGQHRVDDLIATADLELYAAKERRNGLQDGR